MDTNGKKSINPNRLYSQQSNKYPQPQKQRENEPTICFPMKHKEIVLDAYTLSTTNTDAPTPLVQYQPTPGTMGF